MARFVFLGRLEDIAGAAEIPMPMARTTSLAAVMDRLPPELVAALGSPKVRIAVNGAVLPAEQPLDETMIADADEIAFLPPVSGG